MAFIGHRTEVAPRRILPLSYATHPPCSLPSHLTSHSPHCRMKPMHSSLWFCLWEALLRGPQKRKKTKTKTKPSYLKQQNNSGGWALASSKQVALHKLHDTSLHSSSFAGSSSSVDSPYGRASSSLVYNSSWGTSFTLMLSTQYIDAYQFIFLFQICSWCPTWYSHLVLIDISNSMKKWGKKGTLPPKICFSYIPTIMYPLTQPYKLGITLTLSLSQNQLIKWSYPFYHHNIFQIQ